MHNDVWHPIWQRDRKIQPIMKKRNKSMGTNPEMTGDRISSQVL